MSNSTLIEELYKGVHGLWRDGLDDPEGKSVMTKAIDEAFLTGVAYIQIECDRAKPNLFMRNVSKDLFKND